jgi:phosphate transport system protein
MPRLLDLGLNELVGMTKRMSGTAEETISVAVNAHLEGKNVRDVVYEKSMELKKIKDEVKDLAFELIMKYQPVAIDLRTIECMLDASYGFSRFSRYALDIADLTNKLGDLTECDHTKIRHALSIVQWMVSRSIEAFETRNVELAREVIRKDDEIDEIYNESLINAAQMGKVKDIRCVIADILVIRYLERIGDHACQIASAVGYVVEGKYLQT